MASTSGSAGGLRHERDDGVEGLVGVMEEHLPLRHAAEDVRQLARLQGDQRLEGRLAELLQGRQLDQRPQRAHVEGPRT
jgi:hypothetical protein